MRNQAGNAVGPASVRPKGSVGAAGRACYGVIHTSRPAMAASGNRHWSGHSRPYDLVAGLDPERPSAVRLTGVRVHSTGSVLSVRSAPSLGRRRQAEPFSPNLHSSANCRAYRFEKGGLRCQRIGDSALANWHSRPAVVHDNTGSLEWLEKIVCQRNTRRYAAVLKCDEEAQTARRVLHPIRKLPLPAD
jgi:hypothetical protein